MKEQKGILRRKFINTAVTCAFIVVAALAILPSSAFAYPTVYPTGTTIYKPDKAWSGYTVSITHAGEMYMIDMNGNKVKTWPAKMVKTAAATWAPRVFPGGDVFGTLRERLVQWDWDGNLVWERKWSDREVRTMCTHHDWQREGNSVGYYYPEGVENWKVRGGNSLVLRFRNYVERPEISPHLLADSIIQEINWKGEVVWEWSALDHFEEFNFSPAAKNSIYKNPYLRGDAPGAYRGKKVEIGMKVKGDTMGDLIHMNAVSWLGPNKWYDAGDERFHPENLIADNRQTNNIYIINKKTGHIVWQLGPNYMLNEKTAKIGAIIGQHHAHMIPQGLPGAGNILVFDNGGWAGYGDPGFTTWNNNYPATGINSARRHWSRVVEINPVTLEKVWEYSEGREGNPAFYDPKFFSVYTSSAQRLPNGNTFINSGTENRIFEVTADNEIVWEYIPEGKMGTFYRADRIPYSYIPQLKKPVETAVIPPANKDIKMKHIMKAMALMD